MSNEPLNGARANFAQNAPVASTSEPQSMAVSGHGYSANALGPDAIWALTIVLLAIVFGVVLWKAFDTVAKRG